MWALRSQVVDFAATEPVRGTTRFLQREALAPSRRLQEILAVPEPSEETLAFQCPKCGKRLKAGASIAGRRVNCPKCGQSVTVPGVRVAQRGDSTQDDWLSLDVPAIPDVPERRKNRAPEPKRPGAGAPAAAGSADSAKKRVAQPSKGRNAARPGLSSKPKPKSNPARDPTGSADTPLSESPASRKEVTSAQVSPKKGGAGTDNATKNPTKTESPSGSPSAAMRSVFDDDLPELAELDPSLPQPSAASALAAAVPDDSSMDDLDDLVPDLDGTDFGDTLPPLYADEPEEADPDYRILCKTCGTAQYVKLSSKGMKIKCPDCYSEFKIPGPPPGWSPKKKKMQLSAEPDVELAPPEPVHHAQTVEAQRSRASEMLEKAKREISEEDLDNLYGGDFDTAGFVQGTFGFLKDVIAVAHVIGYGIVFAGLFAMAQFGANNADSGFGRGLLLLVVIGAPLVAMLFALPMLSGGLALLESVANRQRRVEEWPGFNMFDNIGDVIAIAASLAAALLPGFFVGTWLGGDQPGAGRMQIAGMMATTFAFFPIFLLSIMDNGSIFQPVSGSILQSFTKAAESWGAYYVKTMLAFFCVMLAWYLLLGKTEIMAAIAGFLLPLLVFFTCQQIGTLADGISEHLSFEFEPAGGESEPDGDDVADHQSSLA